MKTHWFWCRVCLQILTVATTAEWAYIKHWSLICLYTVKWLSYGLIIWSQKSHNRHEDSTFFVFRSSNRVSWIKAIFTTKVQDEDSSPPPDVTPPGGSHPCGQWATGAKGKSAPGHAYCYPETGACRERHAGSSEAQHHHAPPPTTSHVHWTDRNPRYV